MQRKKPGPADDEPPFSDLARVGIVLVAARGRRGTSGAFFARILVERRRRRGRASRRSRSRGRPAAPRRCRRPMRWPCANGAFRPRPPAARGGSRRTNVGATDRPRPPAAPPRRGRISARVDGTADPRPQAFAVGLSPGSKMSAEMLCDWDTLRSTRFCALRAGERVGYVMVVAGPVDAGAEILRETGCSWSAARWSRAKGRLLMVGCERTTPVVQRCKSHRRRASSRRARTTPVVPTL